MQLPTSIAFETKQPIDYNWLWEVSDLDDFTDPGIPFDRHSYHTLVKAQVFDNHLFVARGTGNPCEFLWIDVPSGDIQYAGQFLSTWNRKLPFIYHHSCIILNFQDSIEEIEISTKRLQRFHSIPLSSPTHFGIGATEYSVLLEKPSQSIQKISKSTQKLEWEYLFPDSLRQYKVVGYTEEYVALIENLMDQWHIRFLSMDTGEMVFQSDLPKNTLRLSSQLQLSTKPDTNSSLYLSILQKDGFCTNYTFSIPPNQVEQASFLQATQTIASPLWKETPLEIYHPSVNKEVEGLGWNVFWEGTRLVVCSSISSPKKGSTLQVHCLDTSLKPLWQQQYISTEHSASIVSDAYLFNEMITFQYPLQKPGTSKLYQAFWLDIQTGHQNETIHHYLDALQESPEKGLIVLPNILIITDYPESYYMDSIVGWYFYSYTFARENLGTLHYSPMQSDTVANHTYKQSPDVWKFKRYPSFVYQNEIRYFVEHYDEDLDKMVSSCARFDMIQKKDLPSVEFPQFYGFNKDRMILHDQYLVTAVDQPYDTPLLICYDLEKGKIAWEEYYKVIGLFGTTFLTCQRSQSGTIYSAIQGESGEELWSFTFPSQDTYFCGFDDSGQAYFQRNSILSILGMNDGELKEEILLSFPHPINISIHGKYILFQSYGSTITCMHIPSKEIVWTKDLGDYAQCLIKPRDIHDADQYIAPLKGVFVSESHLFSFNQEGFHLIDMMSGTPLWVYPTGQYQIEELYTLRENVFIAHAKDANDNRSFMQFSLTPGKPLRINLYNIQLENSKWGAGWRQSIDPVISHQRNLFALLQDKTNIFILDLENPILPQSNHQLLEVKPLCTNILVYNNYLIFQACASTDNSDFYLLAYNMGTGDLRKIQKGFHENVHIEWGLLFFELDGLYYSCSFKDFKPMACPDYHPFHLAAYKENVNRYPRWSGYDPLPTSWEVIDMYYIQQVLHGQFTQETEIQTLFITGDGSHSKIGVIEEKDDHFIPGIHYEYAPSTIGSLDFHAMENSPTLPFWQSKIKDLDQDGLDEIIALYYSLETQEATIAIWDYSIDDDCFIPYSVFHEKKTLNPELLEIDNHIFFQHESEDSEGRRSQITYSFVYQSKPLQFSLQPMKRNLPSSMYIQPRGSSLETFQFLENPTKKNLFTTQKTASVKFPYVKILPPHFEPYTNQVTEEELNYLQKRNAYLKKFLKLLDTGFDPFEGYTCTVWQGDTRPYQRPFQLKTLPDEEENNRDYAILYYIDSLFPIQAEGKDYIVVRASSRNYYTHIFLFNPLFECIDSFTYYRPAKGGSTSDAMVSLQNPSRFWIQSDTNTGVDRLLFGNVMHDKLQIKQQFGQFYLYEKQLFHGEKVVFIEKWDTICNIDTKGNHLVMKGYHFLDIWSGHQSDQLLLKEMKQQLPLLYSTLLYCQSFYAKPTLIHEYGGKKIQLPDGREKPLYLSDACYVTQYFEFVFYCYDKYYK
jgi:hypothetical protein